MATITLDGDGNTAAKIVDADHSVPHGRGDEPASDTGKTDYELCSPRAWG